MALGEIFKVGWCDIFNAPIVNHAIGDVTLLDQFPQPRSSLGIVFVVICCHGWHIYKIMAAAADTDTIAITQSCQSPIAH
jgi:hypothetical protein